jgi:hypothetical protein
MSLNVIAQEAKIPLIRPLLSFEAGIVGHSMKNMADELGQYIGAPSPMGASLAMGINAGIFYGERHKLALTLNTGSAIFSTGFWYQYKLHKHKPLFVQLGFTETIAKLYESNRNANPTINNGTLNEYLNHNSSYTIAHFERWTNGINLSVLYSLINTSAFQLNGQIGYLLNFDVENGHWQFMHNNGELNNNTKLPEDSLNGLFVKIVFELDYMKWRKTK